MIAWLMIGVAGIGAALWVTGVISLFWLEIAVALLFAVFWAVQTAEQMSPPAPEPSPEPAVAVTVQPEPV